MKITGRNIKHRLYSLEQLPMRLTRARYFRGHGVHSPFVYCIVRKVFMRRSFIGIRRELYNALKDAGVPNGRAMQLQNIMEHCGLNSFQVDSATVECDFTLCTRQFDSSRLDAAYEHCRTTGTILCIMSPYATPDRQQICRRIIDNHSSTSIDNRGYLLIFNNSLPKQHFRV